MLRVFFVVTAVEARILRFLQVIESVVFEVGVQSHATALLRSSAREGVFGDSGAWETALLRLFDRLFRGGF